MTKLFFALSCAAAALAQAPSSIRFDVKNITAPAGPLEVTLINKGSIAHTFQIPDKNFELATPKKNDTKTGSVTLEKGTYTFRCTISGHEAAGMKGKITVS